MNSDPRIQEFRRNLETSLRHLVKAGLKQQALVVVAETLQYHLAMYTKEEIPCGSSLEVMMRAVMAILAGNPKMGGYIAEKWNYAVNALPDELSKTMPEFAKAMNRK